MGSDESHVPKLKKGLPYTRQPAPAWGFQQWRAAVVQSLDCVRLCKPIDCSTPGFPVLHYLVSLFKFVSIELVVLSNHRLLCCPLLLPAIFPRILMLFQGVGSSHQIAKVLEFQLQHQSFQFRVDFFRIDWFDLLAVQGTLKSVCSSAPQFESINSLAVSLLYGPTRTSVHDYWKNHSFD